MDRDRVDGAVHAGDLLVLGAVAVTLEEEWNEMREKAAALEHEQWAHWTAYMLKILLDGHPDLGRDENVIRWSRQILTDYKDLSEKEKESDRKWADKGIEIYAEFAVNV